MDNRVNSQVIYTCNDPMCSKTKIIHLILALHDIHAYEIIIIFNIYVCLHTQTVKSAESDFGRPLQL